jgi:hypothetical protein
LDEDAKSIKDRRDAAAVNFVDLMRELCLVVEKTLGPYFSRLARLPKPPIFSILLLNDPPAKLVSPVQIAEYTLLRFCGFAALATSPGSLQHFDLDKKSFRDRPNSPAPTPMPSLS